MILLFISFFFSQALILGLIRYSHLHEHFSGDDNQSGPQKFHFNKTTRIGGLGIYLALWVYAGAAFFKEALRPHL